MRIELHDIFNRITFSRSFSASASDLSRPISLFSCSMRSRSFRTRSNSCRNWKHKRQNRKFTLNWDSIECQSAATHLFRFIFQIHDVQIERCFFCCRFIEQFIFLLDARFGRHFLCRLKLRQCLPKIKRINIFLIIHNHREPAAAAGNHRADLFITRKKWKSSKLQSNWLLLRTNNFFYRFSTRSMPLKVIHAEPNALPNEIYIVDGVYMEHPPLVWYPVRVWHSRKVFPILRIGAATDFSLPANPGHIEPIGFSRCLLGLIREPIVRFLREVHQFQ